MQIGTQEYPFTSGSPLLATKIVVSGTDIYIGKAPIGSATSGAVWQVKKIDTASDVIITWADGDSDYDNVMDNAASLSYS